MKTVTIISPNTNFEGLKEIQKKLKSFFKEKYEYTAVFLHEKALPNGFNPSVTIRYIKVREGTSTNEQIAIGFEEVADDFVVICDFNNSNWQEYLTVLIAKWENGAKIVLMKYQREKLNFWQKIGDFFVKTGKLFYTGLLKLFGLGKDLFCINTFQVFDRDVADLIKNLPEKNSYLRNFDALINFETVVVTTKQEIKEQKQKFRWTKKLIISTVLFGVFTLFMIMNIFLYPISKANGTSFTYTMLAITISFGLLFFAFYYLITAFLNRRLGNQE